MMEALFDDDDTGIDEALTAAVAEVFSRYDMCWPAYAAITIRGTITLRPIGEGHGRDRVVLH